MRIAVLDDYQGVALRTGDWSAVQSRATMTVFRDHLSDPAAVIERLQPFEVVCVMRERTPLTREVIEGLPNLKLIASTGRVNAAIDVAAASERGIVVCGTGYVSQGAAELTWALIMAIARQIPAETASIRSGGWQVAVGDDLHGRTIGIVGLGRIGTLIARFARAFEMNVIAWSQNLSADAAERSGARLVTKEDLFRDADFVTLHLVLSRRTRGIVSAAELGLMKPTAHLINTSRGPLVDEEALIDTLRNRRIAGAALDVYDVEPLPPDHPFRSLDNVVTTGHVGFVTKTTYDIFYRDTVENILAWMDGKPMRIVEPPQKRQP
jgi:phosphoglycerate dehydrogenase-like enzyme